MQSENLKTLRKSIHSINSPPPAIGYGNVKKLENHSKTTFWRMCEEVAKYGKGSNLKTP